MKRKSLKTRPREEEIQEERKLIDDIRGRGVFPGERGRSTGVMGMQSPSHYFPVHQAADFCFSYGPQRFRSTTVFLSLRVKLRHTAPSVIITSHCELWWMRPIQTQSSDLIQLWMNADFISCLFCVITGKHSCLHSRVSWHLIGGDTQFSFLFSALSFPVLFCRLYPHVSLLPVFVFFPTCNHWTPVSR